ncbi:MAG: alkyl hydroperoxide reductase/thiol specific antioxidant/Mal allergen [Alphaproteobacteria bacterium]|nr:MAG: alkyl hydroperoxide reductase/thiol specific antioxidant/Mal allergen [Caulobacteraceae bacterium]TPW02142.1 MAG: alkyl hydroperoxide reductase/thiol specific antioxidant/Mal allergen [Alphaproteobacteria bacterium]
MAQRPETHPLIGRRAPDFTLLRDDGVALSRASLAGRWSVIAFLGAWCGDCRRDAPHLAALARAVEPDPALDLVAVHVDARFGDHASPRAYLAAHDISVPVALDADRAVYTAFGVSWLPSYLVIDPDGVVRGFRIDLSTETAGEGGVKRFIQDIAALRSAARD